MESTNNGTLINKESHTQNNHFQMAEDSKSDQEWLQTEHSSGESILDHTNIHSESEITYQVKEDNGSSSIEELEPSELLRRDPTLLPTERDTVTESDKLLLSDHTEERSIKRLPSMEEDTETSKTMPKNVSMSIDHTTETKCTLSSGTATMDRTNNGTSIPVELDIQDNHTQTTEDSKLDLDFQEKSIVNARAHRKRRIQT